MPEVRLPTESTRAFGKVLNAASIAASAGGRLARDAAAVHTDGALRALGTLVEQDRAIGFVTREPPEGLERRGNEVARVMVVDSSLPEARCFLEALHGAEDDGGR